MATRFGLAGRGSPEYFAQEKFRFSDTDMIGRVNSVAVAALPECGRTAGSHAKLFPKWRPDCSW